MKCAKNASLLSIMRLVSGTLNIFRKSKYIYLSFRTRTQHVPVTVVPTVQADKGLWGGEGVLIGYEDFPVVNDYQ